MTDAERQALTEWACQQSVVRFFSCLDQADYESMVSMFTEDGVWLRQGKTLAGQKSILAAMGERSPNVRSRHVVTNFLVTSSGVNECEATSVVTVYRYEGSVGDGAAPLEGPHAILLYRYKLSHAPEGWRIAHQGNSPEFRRKGGGH